jgi:D-alanyl-D-alanine carboxypeptidase
MFSKINSAVLPIKCDVRCWIARAALLAAVMLGLSVGSESYAAASMTASLKHRIDADVRAALDRFDTPGAIVAVVQDGRVIYIHGYGLRDATRKLRVRTDTHFEIGSITKQFTAAAILQLRQAGKLDIDATVATYLPDAPHAGEVTLRQLLTHTSGLHEYFDDPNIDRAAVEAISFTGIMARIKDNPLDFSPGAKWSYSNTGYIMLGRIIEVVSAQTYETYIKTHIIDRLEMNHTDTVSDEPRLADMAVGYRHVDKRLEPAPTISGSFGWAAGNIVTTIGDLIKWDAALRAGKIVSKSDYELMTTPVSTQQGHADYGFAFFIDRVEGQLRIGHTGGSFGFTSANEYFPEQKLQIIAFTNIGDDAPEPGEILTQIIFDDLFPDIAADAARPSPGADPAVTALVASIFVSLEHGDPDYRLFNDSLAGKLSTGLAQRLAKEFVSYGEPTAVIFKGSKATDDRISSDYEFKFGPGCYLKFGVAIDAAGKVASLSIG